jgi:hypothetical protein
MNLVEIRISFFWKFFIQLIFSEPLSLKRKAKDFSWNSLGLKITIFVLFGLRNCYEIARIVFFLVTEVTTLRLPLLVV